MQQFLPMLSIMYLQLRLLRVVTAAAAAAAAAVVAQGGGQLLALIAMVKMEEPVVTVVPEVVEVPGPMPEVGHLEYGGSTPVLQLLLPIK
jgi:hypothetical protein